MSDVMVTGSSGAVGTVVCQQLVEAGHRVLGCDLNEPRSTLAGTHGFDFARCDITEDSSVRRLVALDKPGVLVHTAAILPDAATRNPYTAWQVNVVATATLADAALQSGVGRFVFTSTKGVYENFDESHGFPTYQPVTELYPAIGPDNDHTMYNSTKLAGEYYLQKVRQLQGLDVAVLRFANMYGPGRTHHGPRSLAGDILEAAVAGRTLDIPSGGDERMDLVYLEDVAGGIVAAALTSELAFSTYNIGTGKGYSLKDVAAIVKTLVPDASVSVGDGLDPFGFGRRSYCVLSIERATTDLGFQCRFDLEDGLRAYMELLTSPAHSS